MEARCISIKKASWTRGLLYQGILRDLKDLVDFKFEVDLVT